LKTYVYSAALACLLSLSCEAAVQVVVAGTAARNTAGEAQWLKFQRDAEAAGRGDIKIKMLIRGELGSEDQIVSGLRRGRVQYANLSALIASTIVPETALIYAPYLFDSAREADFIFDRYLTAEFRKLFAARGLEFIVWYDLGFQQIWARKQPLLLPSDARGVRLRISASKSAELLGRAIGADLIPLGYADIIPSLQTGLIEAGENGVTLYSRTGIAPEAPHLTITDHSLSLSVIVADKRWWDKQTAATQKILRASFPSADWIRQATRHEIQTDLNEAAKLKFKVYRLTPTQRAAWVSATRGTHPQLLQAIGGESRRLYELVLAGKKAFATSR
jgi:TRAP-type C4-dicarboxylate transport system substrate-binding protein